MSTYIPKKKNKKQDDKKLYMQNNKAQNEQKFLTEYPFSKKQINKLLNQRQISRQRAFTLHKSKQIIKQHLQGMQNYGYDFRYIQWFFKQKTKEIIRKAYIRCECERCNSKGKNRRWTSYLGCVQIKFKVRSLRNFFERFPKFLHEKSIQEEIQGLKYDKIVQWQLIFYRERCKKCEAWGQTFLYQKQVQGIAMNFCWILANIMQNNPKYPQKKINEGIPNNIVIDHDQQRCEACDLGKCWYQQFSKKKNN